MATPARARRRVPAAQRRELILAAATKVVAEHGYEGASIRRVCEAAGVTPPVIYDHFASKEALQVALLEAGGDELIAAATQDIDAETAEAFLRASVDAFFTFVEEHPHVWRLLFRDPPSHPKVVAAHECVMKRASEAVAGMFALTPRWQTSARLRRADKLAALGASTRSAMNGLAAWWWEHPDVPRREVVALAMDLLWTGIERLQGPVGVSR